MRIMRKEANIVVGLPFKEVFINWDDYEKKTSKHPLLQSTFIDVIEPYYDAELEDCLVGIVVVRSEPSKYLEIQDTIVTEANRELFYKVTGKKAKVYLTNNTY